ncbi:Polymerase/histidinol phosphatase-like [Striga hermonthica]|uniref:Polymerase/histidinol phosphatase-like n=1 Tax=Striga hermonthica TaxID=68872 RepID=A0A9N7MCZ6_STRHE|nr:Polymerase/histidinol phosphatase-like [Striga hermonthica]
MNQMMGDKENPRRPMGNNGKKKKKKRGGAKRKMTLEQTVAYKAVSEWIFLDQTSSNCNSLSFGDPFLDDFGVKWYQPKEKLVFEFHCHTTCSDGFLSPTKLVERAHQKGVKVLALTDHDTMSGIPEAIEAARKFGIKIIPGVEISTIYYSRGDSGTQEPVHILAYYSSCGPARPAVLEKFLGDIRDGRFLRAKNIVSKLNKLKLPVKWENVVKIAGKGAAPGRLHIARAMLEAGHVENLKQAFSRYLHDGGPAYSTGSEPMAEETVKLILETGGVAILAHPWALKNPAVIIRKLKDAGLHGLEVYRSDGKLSVYSDLADAHDLLKLGGSDYHGKGGQQESDVGTTSLPLLMVHEFLKVARPIWCSAIRDILESYIQDPSESNFQHIVKFGKTKASKSSLPFSSESELINHCLSSWLSNEERESADFVTIKLELDQLAAACLQLEAHEEENRLRSTLLICLYYQVQDLAISRMGFELPDPNKLFIAMHNLSLSKSNNVGKIKGTYTTWSLFRVDVILLHFCHWISIHIHSDGVWNLLKKRLRPVER